MNQHMTDQPRQIRLNQDDQRLVNEFVSTGVNRTERKPFRPWIMMLWLTLSIIVLGVAARLVGTLFLPY